MLSEVKGRLEGPKYRQGKGIGMSTIQKGAIFGKCLNTFVPLCRFTCMYTYQGFLFFSISSRTFKLLEFLNLQKIVDGGGWREREKRKKNMWHV